MEGSNDTELALRYLAEFVYWNEARKSRKMVK